jgi:Phospholipase A2
MHDTLPPFITPNNGFGKTPVHGPWTYGNCCGPGGSGTPINPTDTACMAHDACYAQAGFTAGSKF